MTTLTIVEPFRVDRQCSGSITREVASGPFEKRDFIDADSLGFVLDKGGKFL